MFLIKKIGWLEFVFEEYDPRISKAAHFQVRTMDGRSNAKIVKFADGSMFLRVGSEMYGLRNVKLPVDYAMVEKCEGGYKKVCDVSTKCFVTESKAVN